MSHSLFTDASFFPLLLQIDKDLASQAQDGDCLACGGSLDAADFMRKPRGHIAGLGDEFDRRFSFCCREDGCRKRMTPNSVRFCGRRSYLAFIVLLVAAACQGLSVAREQGLREALGVDRRTIGRWLLWWRDSFPQSHFWQTGRARFMPPLEEQCLASAVTESFQKGAASFVAGVTKCLEFLAPGFR